MVSALAGCPSPPVCLFIVYSLIVSMCVKEQAAKRLPSETFLGPRIVRTYWFPQEGFLKNVTVLFRT